MWGKGEKRLCFLVFLLLFACSENIPDDYVKGIIATKEIALRDSVETDFITNHIRYDLSRENNTFKGRVISAPPQADFNIPLHIVDAFLKQLTLCRVHKGKYHSIPYRKYLLIYLHFNQSPIVFKSLNKEYNIWRLELSGNDYLIQSDCPAKAWAILAPYL